MTAQQTNIIVCPSCGFENIEGVDTCENCQADLRTLDVPETRQLATGSELARPISSLRCSAPRVIAPERSVREAITLMRDDIYGAVVVVSAGKVTGIFTERDVLKKVAGLMEALDAPVSVYMTPDPVVLREDDMVAVALNKMGDGGFRHIPIVRGETLVGMLTARDVMSWVLGRYFA